MRIILLALCVWLCQASTEEPCNRPKIKQGFVAPLQESYHHNTKVSYSCNSGMKPALKTWWGELLCDNGKWFPIPRCVSKTDCIAQDVKNSKPVPAKVSYPDNSNVTFICNKGFKAEGQRIVMVTCKEGEWAEHSECERDESACNAPRKVNKAMITRPYQDTFEHADTVEYICQKGFRLEGNKTSTCLNGTWTGDPIQCVEVKVPTQPEASEDSRNPSRGESTVPEGGSKNTRDSSDTGPAIPHVRQCGTYPTIENGDVTEQDFGRSLKVECATFYTLEGPENVMCVLGEWSKLPVCKAPCKLDDSKLIRSQRDYLIHGEEDTFWCSWGGRLHVKCVNGRAYYRGCGLEDW